MDPVLLWACSIVLSILFISAGWHKIGKPGYYQELIHQYIPVPMQFAALANTVLALVEIGTGILLLYPVSKQPAAWLALSLLLFYLVLIAVSLFRGLDMDCGCSGPLIKQKLSPWLLFRNVVLISLAGLLTFSSSGRLIGFTDYLIIFFASVMSILLYVSFEQLLVNRDKLKTLGIR